MPSVHLSMMNDEKYRTREREREREREEGPSLPSKETLQRTAKFHKEKPLYLSGKGSFHRFNTYQDHDCDDENISKSG